MSASAMIELRQDAIEHYQLQVERLGRLLSIVAKGMRDDGYYMDAIEALSEAALGISYRMDELLTEAI